MTTLSLRRLSGSMFAGFCALAIAAGCSENQNPVKPDGPDVTPVPPSPLCGATNQNTGAGGGVGVAGMPVPGIGFSPFQPQYGSTVTANVPPKVAQTLARHSTITLTMDRYAHLRVGDLVEGLKKLPAISPENGDHQVR